jgi:hypothetical protein
MELTDLKKQYFVLEKRHKIPSFNAVNEDFEIDKIDKESDCLIRIVRKIMMEKIVNTLQFLDSLTNPVNAPRIYHSYIKSMSVEDRKIIEGIYDVLAKVSLDSLALEVEYNEKREAELIKEVFKAWQDIKLKLGEIIKHMSKPNSEGVKKEKSYYG